MNTFPKLVEKSKKRIGRGHGSGKVKTAGRGQKGEKARGTVRHGFEGGQKSILHRLPFLRGKARNHSQKELVVGLPLGRLTDFKTGDTITIASLVEKKLITPEVRKVKLIGAGPIDKSLKVSGLTLSKGAKTAIENAGGSIS